MRSLRISLRQIRAALLLLPAVSYIGCATPERALQRFEFKQPHMGTLFAITLYAPDAAAARRAVEASFARVAALDRMMTDYDPDSELMRLCRRPVGEAVRVSDDLFAVLQESERVSKCTDGAFDVTIGPLVRLWRRARRIEVLPGAEQLARARASVGWQKLKLDGRSKTVTLTVTNMQLDLGGIAKGYAADQALIELQRQGFSRALVAASGDIAVGDSPPGQPGWRVEIGSLASTNNTAMRVLLLRNAAVSTSGDTEQFVEIGGKHYSHIVNPRTGVGLTERLQATIIARRATQTDAFATAVSVLGVRQGLLVVESQPQMAALIVVERGPQIEVRSSKRFEAYTRD